MSRNTASKNNEESYIYRQGLANLALEGMNLSYRQQKLVRQYHKGKISREEFTVKAIEYARSR